MITGGLEYKYEIVDGDSFTGGIRIITPLMGVNVANLLVWAIGIAIIAVIALGALGALVYCAINIFSK